MAVIIAVVVSYEEDHGRPPHWAEHYRRELERERSSREHEPEREDERKYRRRRENAKCCCPDRELDFQGGAHLHFTIHNKL